MRVYRTLTASTIIDAPSRETHRMSNYAGFKLNVLENILPREDFYLTLKQVCV